jgi:hypothetical protein
MMQLSRAFRDSEAMKQVPQSASILQSQSVGIGFFALFKLSPNVRESIQCYHLQIRVKNFKDAY